MRYLILLIILAVCVNFIIFHEALGESLREFCLNMIEKRLDYERAQEVGDDFNKISWGDLTFEINHHKNGNNLEHMRNEKATVLLENITSYKILNNKLYVVSKDGYAIIDSDNIAKIYTTGESCLPDIDDRIIYISNLSDFNKNDLLQLTRMK